MPRTKKASKASYVSLFNVNNGDLYDVSGYYLARLRDRVAQGTAIRDDTTRVFVGDYYHGSYYGSDEAINSSLDDEDWVWSGLASDLYDLVLSGRDLKSPKLIEEDDYNYIETVAFYTTFKMWYETVYETLFVSPPPEMLDKDVSGLPILRLPRLYAKAHGFRGTLPPAQLQQLGKQVSAEVQPMGKCSVSDVPFPINRYDECQYGDLMDVISKITL